jgi:serine/threonine protein kinase
MASPKPSVSFTKTLEAPTREPETGSIFAGRYQIIEELGKGGMGKIYRALDKKLNEEVALKLIKAEIAAERKTLERFQNELKLARKISHIYVGRMYELMEEKGTHFITMEYVAGEDLKSFIRRSRHLAVETAVVIGRQIAEGLAAAHRLGVIHRDLKPSNVMIDREGNAKIMDFGIARSIAVKGITGAGVMIGTPEYMSPEQVEGKEVDQRSDIYSLGIILYEMLTGQVPFEGDTPFTIGVKQKSEIPRDPKELNAQTPQDLSRLVLKCLEKEKERRYQSAGELHEELAKIEKGVPTEEREISRRGPLTSREITVKFQLKKLSIPALGIIIIAIGALVIWRFLPKKQPVPPSSGKPTVAVMYFENNTGKESLENWRSGLCDLLITDLSQSKYIDVLGSDQVYSVLSKLNLLEKSKYSSGDLKRIVSETGVNHIIKGSYITAGPKFIINISISKADFGKAVSTFKEEGTGEETIPDIIDKISVRIKTDLNLSQAQIASDIDDGLGKITSGSPEAVKAYLEGQKFYRAGHVSQAKPFFEKAVAIDPEFAKAYQYLAWVHELQGNRIDKKKYLQKAFELSEKASERERYDIQASYYWESQTTWDKAIEACCNLLNIYPDSPNGHAGLIDIYVVLEDWEKVIEHFEKMRHFTGYASHYFNQSLAYSAQGMYDKAREILEYWLKNVSEFPHFRHVLAWTHLSQGKYDLALAEVDKALPFCQSTYPLFLDSNFLTRGDIHLCQGEFAKAGESYKRLLELEPKSIQLNGIRGLADLHVLRGMFQKSEEFLRQGISLADELDEKAWASDLNLRIAYLKLQSGDNREALQACEEASRRNIDNNRDVDQKIRILHLKGIILLENGREKEAQGIADELKATINGWLNPKLIRYHDNLIGKIDLEEGEASRAIERFEAALSFLPCQAGYLPPSIEDYAMFFEPLAQAYFRSGALEKSRETYEKITSLTSGRIHFGDIYARSFYMLGKIFEKQGDRAAAAENYRKFLDLWKNADPDRPEPADARKRLVGLT